MTMPDQQSAVESLFNERQRFASRPDIGDAAGLMVRMLRAFIGNPIRYVTATSANSASPQTLPRDGREMTAVISVLGQPIIYRTDGTIPSAALDQQVGVGGIITLTGHESIIAFVFASANASLATLAINYYD